MIEQILGVTLGVMDTVMISRVSEAAMSGVSLVGMVNNLIISVFGALATGGAVVVARFIGSGDRDGAQRASSQLLTVSLIFSTAIAAVILAGGKPLLRLIFGAVEDDVMASASAYMTITALSFPAIALYNSAAASFRAIGNSRISMIASGVVNLINVAGNAIFIYGLSMGAAGAAWATLAARAIAAAYLLVQLSREDCPARATLRGALRLERVIVGQILYIGVPSGLENSLFQLGRVLVVSIISAYGTTQIAANAVANNFDALGCIPGQAISLAMLTVVGQCVGARDYDEAKRCVKVLMKTAYICSAVVNISIIATLPLTFRIYDLSPETLRLAAILICIHDGFAVLLWPLSFTLPNALRASGDVVYAMVVSVGSMMVVRLLLSYILGGVLGLGAIGVWISMVIDWVVRSTLLTLRYKKRGIAPKEVLL